MIAQREMSGEREARYDTMAEKNMRLPRIAQARTIIEAHATRKRVFI
ncbi:MAG: hypothetical protein NTV89_08455 [Proteobacteria bacterium]|nr:hypothetical protein [Pseudomonadota bacterium]